MAIPPRPIDGAVVVACIKLVEADVVGAIPPRPRVVLWINKSKGKISLQHVLS